VVPRTTRVRRSDKCPDFRERMVRVKAAKRRGRRVALTRAIAPAESMVGASDRSQFESDAVGNWLTSNVRERTAYMRLGFMPSASHVDCAYTCLYARASQVVGRSIASSLSRAFDSRSSARNRSTSTRRCWCLELGDCGLRHRIPIAGLSVFVRRCEFDDPDFPEVVHPVGAHRLETPEDHRVDGHQVGTSGKSQIAPR
jgi:hypothetical protein